jgi:hypothetical protein
MTQSSLPQALSPWIEAANVSVTLMRPDAQGLVTTGLTHLHGYRPFSAKSGGDRHIGSAACVGSRLCPTAT